jgi:hypothetical protein
VVTVAKFNGVTLSEATVLQTREWYARNAQACIDEVKRGDARVNDPAGYFAWMETRAAQALAGEFDETLSFLQRAHFIQTGECVALLP